MKTTFLFAKKPLKRFMQTFGLEFNGYELYDDRIILYFKNTKIKELSSNIIFPIWLNEFDSATSEEDVRNIMDEITNERIRELKNAITEEQLRRFYFSD